MCVVLAATRDYSSQQLHQWMTDEVSIVIHLRLKLLRSTTFQLASCQLLKFLCKEEWVWICGSLASIVYLQFSFFALKLLWWKRWGIHNNKTLIYNDIAVSFGLRAFIHHPSSIRMGWNLGWQTHTNCTLALNSHFMVWPQFLISSIDH